MKKNKASLLSMLVGTVLVLQSCASVAQETQLDGAPLEKRADTGIEMITESPAIESKEEKLTPEELAAWKQGMPFPEGYELFNGQLIDGDALQWNDDGTLSWISSDPPPVGFVVENGMLVRDPALAPPGHTMVDGVPVPDEFVERMKKATSGSNSGNQASAKPGTGTGAKQTPPSVKTIKPGFGTGGTATPAAPDLPLCPRNRNENPDVYDACHAGFVAPKFEFVGYHSCKKIPDGYFKNVNEPTFQLFATVKMVGGNYKGFVWNEQTYKGMALVVQTMRVSDPSYSIDWYVRATFTSMDARYAGFISTEGDNGLNWIDKAQIAPSCIS